MAYNLPILHRLKSTLMKPFFVITLSALAILTACKKKTTDPGPGMFARINGVSWAATAYSAKLNADSFLLIYGQIGSDSTGTDIALGIDHFGRHTGSYAITLTGDNESEYADHSINAWHLGTAGSIVVTKITADNIQGRFNFTSDVSVTDGTFNVPLY